MQRMLKRSFRLPLVFCLSSVLLLLLAACGGDTTDTRPVATAPEQKIDQQLTALANIREFSGVVLIAQKGKKLLQKAYGLANTDQNIANSTTTTFSIGSLTQEFTALAVLQLQEQGKLKVQDSICTYINGCPATWQPITLDMLLSNTAALDSVTSAPAYAEVGQKPQTTAQLVELLKPLALTAKAGSGNDTNGSDYILLSAVIEKVGGQTYTDYIQQHILSPTHLKGTGFLQSSGSVSTQATGYTKPGIKADTERNITLSYASQGLYSTAEDLYAWDQALLKHTVASQTIVDTLMSPHAAILCPTTDPTGKTTSCNDAGKAAYTRQQQGYSWTIGTLTNGQTVKTDTGSIDGFYASNSYIPSQDITIVVLSNIQNPSSDITGLVVGTMLNIAA